MCACVCMRGHTRVRYGDTGFRIQMSNMSRITQFHLPVKKLYLALLTNETGLYILSFTLLDWSSANQPYSRRDEQPPAAIAGRRRHQGQLRGEQHGRHRRAGRHQTMEPWQRCDGFPQHSPHKINIINIKQYLKPSKWKIQYLCSL